MDMNDSAAALNASVNSTEVAQRINAEKYLVPIAFGFIFMVGSIGNGSLMFIICRYKSMRNLPNIFVFNLALGDLCVLIFAIPFTSSIYTLDLWPFGEFVCKASEFAKDTSVSVSVFTLTALSFDRYNVIVKPVQSYVAGPKSKRYIIISLAVIWLGSLALALPAAIFSHLTIFSRKLLISSNSSTFEVVRSADAVDDIKDDHQPEGNQTQTNATSAVILYRFCYPFPGKFGVSVHSRSVILGRFLIQYLIPLTIISTFYTITARNLLRSTENIDGQATVTTASSRPNRSQQQHPSRTSVTNNSNSNQESRRKVAVMVQSFVALFLICFLPMHIFFMWFYFDANSQSDYNHFWNSLKIVGFVFAYANSCINPIALYFISSNFRKHFDRLLFCCCRARNPTHIEDETVKPRPRNHGRDDNNPALNEFRQCVSNPLTSSEQTPTEKQTNSTQNDESNAPQNAVISVHDDDNNSQITHRNPLSVIISPTI